jgi:hypothetical protein
MAVPEVGRETQATNARELQGKEVAPSYDRFIVRVLPLRPDSSEPGLNRGATSTGLTATPRIAATM